MYPVSEKYKTAVEQTDRTVAIVGSIIPMSDAPVLNITENNIAQGTLYLTEEMLSGSDIEVGSVVASELGFVLINDDLAASSLAKARVSLSFKMLVDETLDEWETIPLGKFTVVEAKRTNLGISLICYDDLIKFDKAWPAPMMGATPITFIRNACTACGVVLESNESDFAKLPNYNKTLVTPISENPTEIPVDDGTAIVSSNSSPIETYLDLIMWVCQAMGSNARMTRDGTLEIKAVTSGDSVTTIDRNMRYNATISDYRTKITRVSTTMEKQEIWVGTDEQTLRLEKNPFWATKTADEVATMLNNIRKEVTKCEYVPFEAQIVNNPALQAGDFINLKVADEKKHLYPQADENGIVKTLITNQTWRFRKTHSISALGSSANLSNIRSQSSKQSSSSQKETSKVDEISKESLDKSEQAEIKASEAQRSADVALQDALDAWQKAQQVKTDFNNLQIGGRNLLRNSRTVAIGSNNAILLPISIENLSEGDRSFVRIKRTNPTSHPTTMTLFNAIRMCDINKSIFDNEQIVVSFKARASRLVESSVLQQTYGGSTTVSGNLGNIDITTEWKTFQTVLPKIPTDIEGFRVNPYMINTDISDFYLDLCEWKIEKGTKATDWTPAPEDVEEEINNVLDLANTKGKVIIQSSTPSTADRDIKNLWIDTTGGANTPKYWNGTAWTIIQDKAIQDAANAAANAYNEAIQAQTMAGRAQATADTALTSANSKNSVFHDTSEPSGTGGKAGDIWFQHDANSWEILGQWSYTGDGWLKQQLNHTAIASIDLGKATVGHLTADKVRLENFSTLSGKVEITNDGKLKAKDGEFSGKITTNNLTATGGEIAGWGISTNYIVSTDTVNKRYTMLNSGKGGSEFALVVGMPTEGSNPSPAAYIKHDGEVKFSKGEFNGKITSDSGSIGGWTIGSSNIRSGSGNNMVFLSGGTSDYALWAGNANATLAPLQLKKDGTGKMGSWTISTKHLYSGSGNNIVFLAGGDSSYALWAGSSNATKAPLQIKKDGTLIAYNSADGYRTEIIEGRINFRGLNTTYDSLIYTNGMELILQGNFGVRLNTGVNGLWINSNKGYTGSRSINGTVYTFTNGILTSVS